MRRNVKEWQRRLLRDIRRKNAGSASRFNRVRLVPYWPTLKEVIQARSYRPMR